MVLGVVRQEIAMDFDSKEVEPMHDDGGGGGGGGRCPLTVLGLLKSPD